MSEKVREILIPALPAKPINGMTSTYELQPPHDRTFVLVKLECLESQVGLIQVMLQDVLRQCSQTHEMNVNAEEYVVSQHAVFDDAREDALLQARRAPVDLGLEVQGEATGRKAHLGDEQRNSSRSASAVRLPTL